MFVFCPVWVEHLGFVYFCSDNFHHFDIHAASAYSHAYDLGIHSKYIYNIYIYKYNWIDNLTVSVYLEFFGIIRLGWNTCTSYTTVVFINFSQQHHFFRLTWNAQLYDFSRLMVYDVISEFWLVGLIRIFVSE